MTPLDLLAPDQRAVLELVLRQQRSYGELSELLGIPERRVRERAESALRSLAGTPEEDVDTGRLTDWLLGQQTERAAAATRRQLAGFEPARAWAGAAAERLRELGGDRVPAVPEGEEPGGDGDGAAPRPRREDAAPRPRPLREAAPAALSAGTGPTASGGTLALPRSSRLGGALLIGVVGVVVAAFLVWLITRGDGGGGTTQAARAAGAPAVASSTPSPTPQATGNDVLLRGVNGSSAVGLMRLFKAQGGGVQFAIGAQNMPANQQGRFYAVWFTKRNGDARLLGFPQTAVTNGVLTVGGPGKGDAQAFPRWFATYDRVLITRETKAKPGKPGPAVLAGTLPHGQSGG